MDQTTDRFDRVVFSSDPSLGAPINEVLMYIFLVSAISVISLIFVPIRVITNAGIDEDSNCPSECDYTTITDVFTPFYYAFYFLTIAIMLSGAYFAYKSWNQTILVIGLILLSIPPLLKMNEFRTASSNIGYRDAPSFGVLLYIFSLVLIVEGEMIYQTIVERRLSDTNLTAKVNPNGIIVIFFLSFFSTIFIDFAIIFVFFILLFTSLILYTEQIYIFMVLIFISPFLIVNRILFRKSKGNPDHTSRRKRKIGRILSTLIFTVLIQLLIIISIITAIGPDSGQGS
jgi:hypothetical protein